MIETSAVERRLQTAEPVLREVLGEQGLSMRDCAALLARFIETPEFRIEILTPGLSGASTLLLLQDSRLPQFVKIGRTELIKKEVNNFSKLIIGRMPQRIRPANVQLSSLDDNPSRSALSYNWVGDEHEVQTLNQLIQALDLYPNGLAAFVRALADGMWTFHAATTTGYGIAGVEWSNEKRKRILNRIESAKDTKPEISKLLPIVTGEKTWPQLRLKHSAKGLIHGDFHCKNVLSATELNAIHPYVVDFFRVSKSQCPARDWARLERELKFLTLQECSRERFPTILAAINNNLNNGKLPPPLEFSESNCLTVIQEIRHTYIERAIQKGSEVPRSEYLYHLLYSEIEYLSWDNFTPGSIEENAAFESILCAYRALETAISQETTPSTAPQVPLKLRQWQYSDTLTSGAAILSCLVCIVVATLVYKPLKTSQSTESILNQTREIVNKYGFSDAELQYEVSYDYSSKGDEEYASIVQQVDPSHRTRLLALLPRWTVRAHFDGDQTNAAIAIFDCEGKLIRFHIEPNGDTEAVTAQEAIPQERLASKATLIAEDLFHIDLTGQTAKPYSASTRFYYLYDDTLKAQQAFPATAGAPFHWILNSDSSNITYITLNLVSDSRVKDAKYWNTTRNEFQQVRFPNESLAGVHKVTSDKSTVFSPFMPNAYFINSEIRDWISPWVGLTVFLLSLVVYWRNRKIIRKGVLCLAWIIAIGTTVSNATIGWFHSGIRETMSAIALSEDGQSAEYLLFAGFFVGGIIVLAIILIVARGLLENAAHNFPDHVSTIFSLSSAPFRARGAGLSIIRGTCIGIIMSAFYCFIQFELIRRRLGAPTVLSEIAGMPIATALTAAATALGIALATMWIVLVTMTMARWPMRWRYIISLATVLAAMGPFILPGAYSFAPIVSYPIAFMICITICLVATKYDFLAAFSSAFAIQIFLLCIPVALTIGESTRWSMIGIICWLIYILIGIAIWLRPYFVFPAHIEQRTNKSRLLSL